MKQNRNLIGKCLAMLPLLWMAACSGNDEPSNPPMEQQGGAVITLAVDAGTLETRSTPDDPNETTLEGTQHVENVKLYIFKHGENNEVTYINEEQVTNWPNASAVDYHTTSISYELTTSLEANTRYTLLAVGYENTEVYTIDLPEKEHTVSLTGLISKIYNENNISANEYFTGALEVTTNAESKFTGSPTIEMNRRVAGMSACFKLTGFPADATRIDINLYTKQNTAVPTLPKGGNDYVDDAQHTGTKNTLMSIDISNGTKENGTIITVRQAAYLLPIKAPAATEAETTLFIAVYGNSNQPLKQWNAILPPDETGERYRYPIEANHFYRFGTESDPTDLNYDALNPFVIMIADAWEGIPDLDFAED